MRATAIDRRIFLTGSAAFFSLPTGCLAGAGQGSQPRATFGGACIDENGKYAFATFSEDGMGLQSFVLPGRGHDTIRRPGRREAVVFARRPGNFAVAFDLEQLRPPSLITGAESRHFFGHGIFSADGRLLLSTENDLLGGQGVLEVRDATNGYHPVGSIPTNGIGPHDVTMLSDSRTLVVANGGVDTEPDGRTPIYLDAMRPSLVYVDMINGDVLEQVEWPAELRPLSIRHLAVGCNDTVVFGCQWAGDKIHHPPLVGVHQRGQKLRLLDLPKSIGRRLRNYIGSVAVDKSGEIAALSSPRGGLVVFFDIPAGRYLGAERMTDVCGVAEAAAHHTFQMTSGYGHLRTSLIDRNDGISRTPDRSTPYTWDNHLIRL